MRREPDEIDLPRMDVKEAQIEKRRKQKNQYIHSVVSPFAIAHCVRGFPARLLDRNCATKVTHARALPHGARRAALYSDDGQCSSSFAIVEAVNVKCVVQIHDFGLVQRC